MEFEVLVFSVWGLRSRFQVSGLRGWGLVWRGVGLVVRCVVQKYQKLQSDFAEVGGVYAKAPPAMRVEDVSSGCSNVLILCSRSSHSTLRCPGQIHWVPQGKPLRLRVTCGVGQGWSVRALRGSQAPGHGA